MLNLWDSEHLQTLNTLFHEAGHSLRIVGGAVRDAVLGVPSKDVDLCTSATPDEVMALATRKGVRFVPTGLQHGTVSLILDGVPYEVTTLRIDVETDGRHAEVEFTRDFLKDAGRRDFTWNAMSVDAEGNLYDYFNGVDHLRSREIHFVGDAEKRVREDYLRVLRFFRFAARYECTFDDRLLDMFAQQFVHEGLKRVSKERVWQEMSKLLVSKDRLRMVNYMWATGLAKAVGLEQQPQVDAFNATSDAVSALSTMVRDAAGFARLWKLSTAERNKLDFLVNTRVVCNDFALRDCGHTATEVVEDMLAFRGEHRDHVVCLASMYMSEADAYYAATWTVPTFPVNGDMMKERGHVPGKEMGQALAALKQKWRNSRYTATASELFA